jgi:hypothetical protein
MSNKFFIMITNPQDTDIQYAKDLMRDYDTNLDELKNKLRPNMTLTVCENV